IYFFRLFIYQISMADSGFDPCECVWSHEMAMRRLLSILRQSQSHCTDNECFNELPGPNVSQGTLGNDTMMFALLWVALALGLFFLRPSSLRGVTDGKPSNNSQGRDNPPPPPPPTST
ncbi:Small integral membrane protein 14, partial [Armadillidium nasatum]